MCVPGPDQAQGHTRQKYHVYLTSPRGGNGSRCSAALHLSRPPRRTAKRDAMRCQSSSTDHSAGTGTAHLSRPTAVCLCPRTTAESQRFLCSRRQVTPTSTVSNVRFPTWMRLECQLTAGGPGSVLQPGCGCFKDACHMSSLVDWKQCFNSVNSAAPSDSRQEGDISYSQHKSANRRAIVGFERTKRIRHSHCHSLPFCTSRQQPAGR